MATINSREAVEKIIENNGNFLDDPPVVKIVKYKNSFDGGDAYGLIYEGEDLYRYENSPFVNNPVTIFERK